MAKTADRMGYITVSDSDVNDIINRSRKVRDIELSLGSDTQPAAVSSIERESVRKFSQGVTNEKAKKDYEIEKRNKRQYVKKVIQLSLFVAIMLVVGAFFAVVLYYQAKLSDLSTENANAKDRISTLKQDIVSAEEENNGITDMDSIRAIAIAMGMQDPDANQVVTLNYQREDNLESAVRYDNGVIDTDALSEATGDLAEYYRGSNQ